MTDQPERGEMKQRVWKTKQMQSSRDFDAFMKANEIAECSACKGTGYVAAESAQPTPILPPFDDPAWDEAVAQRTEQIFGKRQPAPQDATSQPDGYWLKMGAMMVEAITSNLHPDLTDRRREILGEYFGEMLDNAHNMGICLGEMKEFCEDQSRRLRKRAT
jgi:hypothetical protein